MDETNIMNILIKGKATPIQQAPKGFFSSLHRASDKHFDRTIPVEQQFSKDELSKITDSIRFTSLLNKDEKPFSEDHDGSASTSEVSNNTLINPFK